MPQGLADVRDQPDPFVFPELPDEAAAVLDLYNSFQQRYGIQLYRYYRAIDERAARHRSENTGNDCGADAAVTIADGPSPIVKLSPSN